MSEKTENTLRQIGENETREKIKNHLLWLRGSGKEEDRDFTNLDFSITSYDPEYDTEYYILRDIFEFTNLTEANFRNSDISILSFKGATLTGTDFRNAKYDVKKFNDEQLKQVILTDSDYLKYIENKKLEKENKKLKSEVGEKNQTIEKIGETQTNKLLEGFLELKEDFKIEERRWLTVGIITFFLLLGFAIIIFTDSIFPSLTKSFLYTFFGYFILVISSFIYSVSKTIKTNIIEKKEATPFFSMPSKAKIIDTSLSTILILSSFYILLNLVQIGKIGTFEKSLLKIENPYYTIFPIGIILFSFLYFSLYQYSKAKKLRIENQNKIAMIHGYQALRAEKGDGVAKTRFYDNIANVVFTSVYDKNEKHIDQNLPIDRIIDLVKTTIESTTKR